MQSTLRNIAWLMPALRLDFDLENWAMRKGYLTMRNGRSVIKAFISLLVLSASISCWAADFEVQQMNTVGQDQDKEFVCQAQNDMLYGKLKFAHEYKPGLYLLSYEYKTQNVPWDGQFFSSVSFSKSQNQSVNIINSSSTTWSANQVMFELKAADQVACRLRVVGKWMKSQAKVFLRKIELKPFAHQESTNLLNKEGFFCGTEGGFP